MENLALVSSPKMVVGWSPNPRDRVSNRYSSGIPHLFRRTTRRSGREISLTRTATSISALSPPQGNDGHAPPRTTKLIVLKKLGKESFASITSSTSQETSSVGVSPQFSVPPPSSHVGSPLFWIGVGVGLSALFSWAATNLKKYAMQQAVKTLMGQMDSQNNQFNNPAFSPGSPFPFPTPPASRPATSTSPVASRSAVTVDVAATKVEIPPASDIKDDTELENKPKKYAFVDISPEETLQKSPFESFKESTETDSSKDAQFADQVFQNGAASRPGIGASDGSSSSRKLNN
ncbi:protein TIC 40, chloroplastic-like [Cornus florida]|uniref:protein TIC 40, chloroplastic-like n=1 Tax=Cornus florida TaxID=4283 RepID=UPI002899A835|nr:protein TIC 40, chloroplastic-like [Cornus florida]